MNLKDFGDFIWENRTWFFTALVSGLSMAVSAFSLILSIKSRKDQKNPVPRVVILGSAVFDKDENRRKSYLVKERFDLLQEKNPQDCKAFTNLDEYCNEKGVSNNKSGFIMDDKFREDIIMLFSVSSSTEGRELSPYASVIEFKCPISAISMKMKKINIIRPKPEGKKGNNVFSYGNIRDEEVCYTLNKSSFYVLVYEIFDLQDPKSWFCDHDVNEPKILYTGTDTYFTITMDTDKEIYYKIKVRKTSSDDFAVEGGVKRTTKTAMEIKGFFYKLTNKDE
ncbi:MAG: hypothetical protein FWG82_03910 [Oscillospiraceae bacterium]|nr:hypothetical protein [Oscillospiraceae bacterium]